jgi:hypothetical protein
VAPRWRGCLARVGSVGGCPPPGSPDGANTCPEPTPAHAGCAAHRSDGAVAGEVAADERRVARAELARAEAEPVERGDPEVRNEDVLARGRVSLVRGTAKRHRGRGVLCGGIRSGVLSDRRWKPRRHTAEASSFSIADAPASDFRSNTAERLPRLWTWKPIATGGIFGAIQTPRTVLLYGESRMKYNKRRLNGSTSPWLWEPKLGSADGAPIRGKLRHSVARVLAIRRIPIGREMTVQNGRRPSSRGAEISLIELAHLFEDARVRDESGWRNSVVGAARIQDVILW